MDSSNDVIRWQDWVNVVLGIWLAVIKVSVNANEVSISAEVKSEKEKKEGETAVQSERYYRKASRSFSLPQDIDDTKATAKYQGCWS